MHLPLYQTSSFSPHPFQGNPAAVCPLPSWLPDGLMLQIAAENNLSETAFVVREGDAFGLRWFTPTTEVDLCGHATLAAAHVLAVELGVVDDPIVFRTRSGELRVMREGALFTKDFPAQPPVTCDVPERLCAALGVEATEVLMSQDFVVVVPDEALVRGLSPDVAALRGLPGRGVCVTAASRECDFVSRWFGPNVGIAEDPVTGSAHCALAPYWAKRLGKPELRARQVSARGGEVLCRVEGDRVFLTGAAVTYLRGKIEVVG